MSSGRTCNGWWERWYSAAKARTQSAKHVKTVASAIYTHAGREGWFTGPNPAKFVNLPEMVQATAHALSLPQVADLLQLLPKGTRSVTFLAVMTSMNIAEICGLKWKRINLSAEPIIMDDELLPPFMAGVREQWYKRQWGSVKAQRPPAERSAAEVGR
jgi:hypothetical protein